ncbi:unnamed protein product, partial [Durusdinium trenchii]
MARYDDHPALKNKALAECRKIVVECGNEARRAVLIDALVRSAWEAGYRASEKSAHREKVLAHIAGLRDADMLLVLTRPEDGEAAAAFGERLRAALSHLISANAGLRVIAARLAAGLAARHFEVAPA